MRHGVLSVPDMPPADADASILAQMQSSFAHMLLGLPQHHAPEGLWRTYRHYGEQVSVREQQDAREFFDNLIDQVCVCVCECVSHFSVAVEVFRV